MRVLITIGVAMLCVLAIGIARTFAQQPVTSGHNNAMPAGTIHVPTYNTPPVYVQPQYVQPQYVQPQYVQPVPSPYSVVCSQVGTFTVCN